MKKNLSFDTPQVESSFRTGVFIRNLDFLKLCINIQIIITIFKIYYEWGNIHWLLSFLRIIVCIVIFSICVAILNLNKFESIFHARLFLQIDILLNILIKTKIFYGNPEFTLDSNQTNNHGTIQYPLYHNYSNFNNTIFSINNESSNFSYIKNNNSINLFSFSNIIINNLETNINSNLTSFYRLYKIIILGVNLFLYFYCL